MPSDEIATLRVFIFLCLFGWISLTEASTPNVIITVDGIDEPQEWAAKRALFGSEQATVTGELLRAPASDPLLCEYFNPFRPQNETYVADPTRSATALGGKAIILLAPRGNCTFERKAWVAQELYGAVGILVYDNLAARYRWNETTQRVIFPQADEDFECEKGYGMVRNLTLDPPAYDATLLNKFLDRTQRTSTCELNVSNLDYTCESQYCLVTSHSPDSDEYPVCCAWDNLITMNIDKDFKKRDEIQKIMAVMITMRQSEQFLLFEGNIVTMTERKFNAWNLSMFLLWILATCITAYACWYSAQNYRYYRAKLAKIQGKRKKEGRTNHQDGNIEFDDDDDYNGGGKRTHPEREIDINEDEDDEQDDKNDVEAVNVVEQNEEEAAAAAAAQEQVDEYHDEPKNAVPLTQTSKKKNQKKKLGKKKGNGTTTLHSLPTSRSRARDEEEPPEIYTIYRRKKTDNDDEDQEDDEKNNNNKTFTLYSLPPPERKRPMKQRPNPDDIDNDLEDDEDEVKQPGKEEEPDNVANSQLGATEMSIYHVVLFVVVASAMLLILFFLNLYNVVCIIYAIGCAGSVSFLIFGPLIGKFVPKLGSEVVEELNKKVLCNLNGFDVISQGAGFIWAGIWLWYGLSHYRPSQNWFFWISLNIFGACFCIIMLSTFKINSLKIAALLGIAVFFYDIFFVFITPFLTGGSSIMLTVARGGAEGGASADDLCFKYPNHKDCTGIDFLPMLLAFPRINDYRGGSSLLGLGDIVLPGFLISFAARVDEAKRLLAYHTSIEVQNVPHKWYQGYLFPLMCAYAVGLLLANVAVVLMQQGQPALLYLVPCCLGTMAVVGRGELKEMWGGSKILRMADKLIRKCEKHWGQQRMKRALERHKREQAAALARDRGGSRRSIYNTGNGAPQQRGRTSVREESEQNDRGVPPGAGGRQPGRGRGGGPGRGRGRPRPDGAGVSEKRPRPPGEQGKQTGGGGPHDGPPPRRNSTGRRAPTRVGQLDAPISPKKTTTGPPPENQKRSKVGQPDAPDSQKKTPMENQRRPHTAKNPQSAPPSGAALKTPHGKDPDKPAGKQPPTDEDVCFGKDGHPGNLEFNAVIRSTAKAMKDKEYDMSIYKSIRKQLKGRRLFKSTGPGAWAMANKDDAIDLVRDAFNEEKKQLTAA